MNLLPVVKEVMSEVVANISKYPTAVNGCSSVPVVEENGMGEFPER